MMLQDILAVDGLPASGLRIHLVETDAFADAGKGIPGKIKIRDRVQDKAAVGLYQVHQRTSSAAGKLRYRDAGHGLKDHVFLILDPHQIIIEFIRKVHGLVAALCDKLPDETALGLRVVLQHVCHQVLQIKDLHAMIFHEPGKMIVLPLGHLQKRNIIKEQPLQLARHQVFQFLAGPVQHNLF